MIKNLLIISTACLLATGCLHPQPKRVSLADDPIITEPPYSGSSADGGLIFQADNIIKNGAGLISQFLSFAYQNQAVLAQWPQIGATANTLQAKGPDYIEDVIASRKAYHDEPTAKNAAKLTTAISTFTAAYEQGRNFQVQAQQYMAAHPPLPAPVPIPNAPSPTPPVPIPNATPDSAKVAPATSTNQPSTPTQDKK